MASSGSIKILNDDCLNVDINYAKLQAKVSIDTSTNGFQYVPSGGEKQINDYPQKYEWTYNVNRRQYQWTFFIYNKAQSKWNEVYKSPDPTKDTNYNSTLYNWNCIDTNGNYQLLQQTENKIKVKIQPYIERVRTLYTYIAEGKYWKNEGSSTEYVTQSWSYDDNGFTLTAIESEVLKVYTRNDEVSTNFWKNGSYSPASGLYISNHITINNVNAWVTQLGIWKSWKEQEDCYDAYSNLKKSNDDKNTTITANWYRQCYNACHTTTSSVKGLSDTYTNSTGQVVRIDPADATVIKAQHFIDLATAVTTWT